MTILYISVTLIYILFACLDGEDVKPKWKQWIANKLDIKPKIEVKYIKPQTIKLHSRVAISQFEMQYYCHDILRKRAIERVYDGILPEGVYDKIISEEVA